MLVLHFTFFIFSMMLKYEVSIKTIEEIFKKERGIKEFLLPLITLKDIILFDGKNNKD